MAERGPMTQSRSHARERLESSKPTGPHGVNLPVNTYFRESGCFLLNRRRNQPFIINMQHRGLNRSCHNAHENAVCCITSILRFAERSGLRGAG